MTCDEAAERMRRKFLNKAEVDELYNQVQNMDEEEKRKFTELNLACALNMLMISMD